MTRRQGGKAARRQKSANLAAQPLFEGIDIWPEPSPAEREAILVALSELVQGGSEAVAPPLPPWAAAGRRDAVRARQVGDGSGWGRERSAAR